jgi:hypothetical protein
VSGHERMRYRARIAGDADRGRPTETTARAICALVGVDPMALRTPRDQSDKVAAQAFAVAIDWVVRLGDRSEAKEDEFDREPGGRLAFTGLFSTLATYWSIRYRDAQTRGVRVSYDMTEATLTGDDDCAWRELLAAGVNVEAIWALLIRQTRPPTKPPKKSLLPPDPGLAKLYVLKRARGRRHSESRKVQLLEGQLLDDIRYTILRDPQYERPIPFRLLLADDKAPELPARQRFCEERSYDAVNYRPRSVDVLAILEKARLRFYVEQFREDFEALDWFRRHQPRPHRVMRAHRHGYDRVEQMVRSLRPIYEQTAGLANLPRDGQGRAYVVIRADSFARSIVGSTHTTSGQSTFPAISASAGSVPIIRSTWLARTGRRAPSRATGRQGSSKATCRRARRRSSPYFWGSPISRPLLWTPTRSSNSGSRSNSGRCTCARRCSRPGTRARTTSV